VRQRGNTGNSTRNIAYIKCKPEKCAPSGNAHPDVSCRAPESRTSERVYDVGTSGLLKSHRALELLSSKQHERERYFQRFSMCRMECQSSTEGKMRKTQNKK